MGVNAHFVGARVTNYIFRNEIGVSQNSASGVAISQSASPVHDPDASWPTAQITDLVIRVKTENASQTMGCDEFHTYSLAAS